MGTNDPIKAIYTGLACWLSNISAQIVVRVFQSNYYAIEFIESHKKVLILIM